MRGAESASHKRDRSKRSSARKILRVAVDLLTPHHGETISPSVLQYLASAEASAHKSDAMSFNAWPAVPAGGDSSQATSAQGSTGGDVGPLVKSLIKAADNISRADAQIGRASCRERV